MQRSSSANPELSTKFTFSLDKTRGRKMAINIVYGPNLKISLAAENIPLPLYFCGG